MCTKQNETTMGLQIEKQKNNTTIFLSLQNIKKFDTETFSTLEKFDTDKTSLGPKKLGNPSAVAYLEPYFFFFYSFTQSCAMVFLLDRPCVRMHLNPKL